MTPKLTKNQIVVIWGDSYTVAEHPNIHGNAYMLDGRQSFVYQLTREDGVPQALKVFKPRYRNSTLVTQAENIAPFSALLGMQVCARSVVSSDNTDLLQENPDLLYACLMPWVEGSTWQYFLVEKVSITASQSLDIAKNLLKVLVSLDDKGIAHCDLSGSNIILSSDLSEGSVALVDVEGIYALNLHRPVSIPSGSPGYNHKTASQGLWFTSADRFSGAVLLAEILSWPNHAIRQASWGNSYFNPNEIHKEGLRYEMLISGLRNNWGEGIVELFIKAWSSETLADCPRLKEWFSVLPDSIDIGKERDQPLMGVVQQQPNKHIDRGAQRLEDGEILPVGEEKDLETLSMEPAVKNHDRFNQSPQSHSEQTGWICEYCGYSALEEQEICPNCSQGRRGLVRGEIDNQQVEYVDDKTRVTPSGPRDPKILEQDNDMTIAYDNNEERQRETDETVVMQSPPDYSHSHTTHDDTRGKPDVLTDLTRELYQPDNEKMQGKRIWTIAIVFLSIVITAGVIGIWAILRDIEGSDAQATGQALEHEILSMDATNTAGSLLATRQAEETIFALVTADAKTTEDFIATSIAIIPTQWPVLIADKFSSNTNGWNEDVFDYQNVKGSGEISSGKYIWEFEALKNFRRLSSPDIDEVHDFYLSIEASVVRDSDDASCFGVVFRRRPKNYYMYRICGERFSAGRVVQGNWEVIIPWTNINEFLLVDVNQIAVKADGGHFEFAINGYFVGAMDDNLIKSGDVGILVSSSQNTSARIQFDNFILRTP
jgi:hypothetical protein